MLKKVQRIPQGIRRRIIHRSNNIRVEKMARAIALSSNPSQNSPVIFFNASTRLEGLSLNAGFALVSSWALRLAGVPVINFVCKAGMSRCMLGSVLNKPNDAPPCTRCIQQSKSLFSHSETRWFSFELDLKLENALKKLTLAQLIEFSDDGIPFGQIILPAIRWVLRCYQLKDSEETRFLYQQYILSAANIARHFQSLLDESKPQKVVVFNGVSFPEAIVRWVAIQNKIPVITHEVGLIPLSAYFTYGQATEYPIDIKPSFQLNDVQNKRLDHYLEQRFKGDFEMAGVRFWPTMQSLSDTFLVRSKQFRQIVPIFTNVIFDTSQSHANIIFENMFAWLNSLVEVIIRHPETLFVLRAHPDEARQGKASRESVANWVDLNGIDKLDNVFFVNANEQFSSYELIQMSKFVLIYNSTIGMEATLLGTPVLCAGKSRFTRLPTVYFPDTQAEYLQQLELFLSLDKVDLPINYKENVRRFLYSQLFKVSLPFDQFLKEDQVWNGYVVLKDFGIDHLLKENSGVLSTVVDGIINESPFELEK